MIENCKSLFLVRTVTPKFLALLIVLHVVLTSFFNLVVFRFGWLNPLEIASGGLVTPTLLANLCFLGIMLYLLFRVGNLSPKDLALVPAKGIGERSILRGLLWTLAGFLIIHLSIIAYSLAAGAPISWQAGSTLAFIGRALGQFLGNALYEEIFFRALLIPQILLLLKKKNRKWSWNRCFFLALIVSQLVFALVHVPNRIMKGTYTGIELVVADQLFLFLAGLLLAATFLLTRNIYAAVGIHSLVNKSLIFLVLPSDALVLTVYLLVPVLFVMNSVRSKRAKASKT